MEKSLSRKKIKENYEKQVKETFFRIWITKLFISEEMGGVYYYNNFVDEDNNFSLSKYKEVLDYIIDNVLFKEVIRIRENTLQNLPEEKIKEVLETSPNIFTDNSTLHEDLNTLISGGTIILKRNERILSNPHILSEVQSGLNSYINSLYQNGIYNLEIEETMEEIVKKTIEIIKGKQKK